MHLAAVASSSSVSGSDSPPSSVPSSPGLSVSSTRARKSSFSALAGLEDSSVKALLDLNEQLTEDAGVDLPVYIAPGTEHTIMGRAEMYVLEVEGVRYVDWLTDFIAGEAIDDVVCTDCGAPS